MTRPSIPVIAVTLGDPAGIGPEIIETALPAFRHHRPDVKVDVLGRTGRCRPGHPTNTSARCALDALEESVTRLHAGNAHAVVNGPVGKSGLQKIGFRFPGQTEFYARAFKLPAAGVTMVMTSPQITTALVTTHCSLASALRRLDAEGIIRTGLRLDQFLRDKGLRRPRLAVAGLNPHAGEGGAFGREEIRIVSPAVAALASALGRKVAGPVSPDAVFAACYRGEYDGVVGLYHDQALIPFKMIAFADGVNVTAGLPVWRASPDHGTAYAIAGTGQADARSMIAALTLTARLLTGREAP